MTVLQVTGLTVEFGQRGGAKLRAVDDLSAVLRAGQTLALVGESGSGKSTVVRALAQLQKRTAGQILLDGQPAPRRGPALRAYRHRVQLIFQDPFASLNPMHTIRHHLARPLLLRAGQPGRDHPHAMPVCQTSPPDAPVGPGHRALCWLRDPAARAGAA